MCIYGVMIERQVIIKYFFNLKSRGMKNFEE